MSRWQKTVGLIEMLAARVEKAIIAAATLVYRAKEELLLSLVRRYWPPWISANDLTLSRLVVSVAIIIWLIISHGELNTIVFVLYACAILTDLLDGLVARAFNQCTIFGKFLEKLADKTLVCPLAIVELWPQYRFLLFIGCAGMIVTFAATVVNFLRTNFRDVPGNLLGAISMVLFSVAVGLGFWPILLPTAVILGWIAIGLGGVSLLYIYPKRLMRHLDRTLP